jgi:predicted TIM-barrel fold metal-dependent hydrolase
MVIDIHAHYVPRDGQEMAAGIGKRHHLKIDKDDRGGDTLARDSRPFPGPLKAEFHDLDLRASIMDQQGVDCLRRVHISFIGWPRKSHSNTPVGSTPHWRQRFVALASVPMQDSTKAAVELERAMTKLGLRGAGHVLLGSDYPYDMGDPEPVETVRRAKWDSHAKEQIFSQNACGLLRIGT